MDACEKNTLWEGHAVSTSATLDVEEVVEGCKNRCDNNAQCNFFKINNPGNWCLLYKYCNQLKTNGTNGITFARQITGFLT